MKAVIQRVSIGQVIVDNSIINEIKNGYLILLGIHKNDTLKDCDWLINKILNIRLFENKNENFDLNINQIKGEILLISQFTLYANCRKGNRPSFSDALNPKAAQKMYNQFYIKLKNKFPQTKSGKFGATMKIILSNEGPVTINLDSKE